MSDEKLSKQEAKKRILEELTDSELTTLFTWIYTERNVKLLEDAQESEIRDYFLNKIKTRTMYAYLWCMLSGNFPRCSYQEVYQRVLKHLPSIKEKLNSSEFAGKVLPEVDYGEMIELYGPITAFNEHIGEIDVTTHAFKRFCERRQGDDTIKKRSFEYLVTRLKKSFRNAVPKDISPEQRVRRIISNRFEKARYFENTEADLRFVVLEKEPTLITVERPK